MRSRRSIRFAAIYILWIALCAVLFLALRGAEDPSRRSGRIQRDEAGRRAIAYLQASDPQRFGQYEAVHIAFARAGEAGREKRWVVLCDTDPPSALRRAVVVEVRGEDGAILGIRTPRALSVRNTQDSGPRTQDR